MVEYLIPNSSYAILIDDEDLYKITLLTINVSCTDGKHYCVQCNFNGKTSQVGRYLLNYSGPLILDHIDRNPFNNQKLNLRTITPSQSNMNRDTASNNTSGYKGVSWKPTRGKWKAYISYKGKQIHLGYFNDIGNAAVAYNDAAELYYGKFAVLNEVV